MTSCASDPLGMRTVPLLSTTSRATVAEYVLPSVAVEESITSLVRTENSVPAGTTRDSSAVRERPWTGPAGYRSFAVVFRSFGYRSFVPGYRLSGDWRSFIGPAG